eukprot:TRINITY_DN68168_c0_g1_i1.p1 TRINITY_DN68168_c0_g1~~TRINITY_DN68168_c0_g1_i1.p1  ORF type:complete len:223 (+),score=37.97 TRINITY_DN68168_c0_g1_i1:1-669(+)
MPQSAFLWLRNDLSLSEQPLLAVAASKLRAWIYIFDLRFLSQKVSLPGELGTLRKSSARRARFLLQSVRDLSTRLRSRLNADLIICAGHPEEEICETAEKLGWKCWDVYCQAELGTEEEEVQNRLAGKVSARGGQVLADYGRQFLYHPDDVRAATATDPKTKLVSPHHFWRDDSDPEETVQIRQASDCPQCSQQRLPVCQILAAFLSSWVVRRLPWQDWKSG